MTDETGKPKLVGTGVQKGLLRNDQTKTPERIWAYAGTFKMWRDHKTDAPHTQTEYTRADLSDAKDKRIAELEVKNKQLCQDFNSGSRARSRQKDRIAELEAKLAKATDGLRECEEEIDGYIRQEYPGEHPVQARYRERDFAANPARATLEELKGGKDG